MIAGEECRDGRGEGHGQRGAGGLKVKGRCRTESSGRELDDPDAHALPLHRVDAGLVAIAHRAQPDKFRLAGVAAAREAEPVAHDDDHHGEQRGKYGVSSSLSHHAAKVVRNPLRPILLSFF